MTREEVVTLQRQLNAAGYNLAVDGIYGPKTATAYEEMLTMSSVGGEGNKIPTPEPWKPWWTNSVVIASISGLIAGILGVIGWDIDTVDLSTLLTSLAGVVTAGIAIYGAIKNKNPVDPRLIPTDTSPPVVSLLDKPLQTIGTSGRPGPFGY